MREEDTIARLKQLNEPALICSHLLMNQYLNLNFPDNIDDGEAWCDACEAMLQKEGGWTEKLLKFANLKPYCKWCFDEMKEMQKIRQKTLSAR